MAYDCIKSCLSAKNFDDVPKEPHYAIIEMKPGGQQEYYYTKNKEVWEKEVKYREGMIFSRVCFMAMYVVPAVVTTQTIVSVNVEVNDGTRKS